MSNHWLAYPGLLRAQTRRRLDPVIEAGPETDLAQTVAASGRFTLQASCWQTSTAEARVVLIEGTSAAIFNCLIFPRRPDLAPVFVAELLILGGMPRLLFVDVQTPGMHPTAIEDLSDRVRSLAHRYAEWQTEEPAPAWATAYSTGGAVYVRPNNPDEKIPISEVYGDFLQTWRDLTPQQMEGVSPPSALNELTRFKIHHVEESPVADYLSRVFGEVWTGRFLRQFLYR